VFFLIIINTRRIFISLLSKDSLVSPGASSSCGPSGPVHFENRFSHIYHRRSSRFPSDVYCRPPSGKCTWETCTWNSAIPGGSDWGDSKSVIINNIIYYHRWDMVVVGPLRSDSRSNCDAFVYVCPTRTRCGTLPNRIDIGTVWSD